MENQEIVSFRKVDIWKFFSSPNLLFPKQGKHKRFLIQNHQNACFNSFFSANILNGMFTLDIAVVKSKLKHFKKLM